MCVAVAAALVGGTANAAGNAGAQVYQNWQPNRSLLGNLTDVNRTEMGIAFGYGALAGGAATVTGGASALLISASAAAAQEVTTDMVVEGQSFSEAVDIDTAIAAGLGLVGGMVQGTVPDELVYAVSNGERLTVATGREALAYGGRQFMHNTDRQLMQSQLNYVTGVQFSSGVFVGNIPTQAPNPGLGDMEVLGNIAANASAATANAQTGCGFWSCPLQTMQNWWSGNANNH